MLDALPTTTQSDIDFKYTQQINLYRLQDENFTLNGTQNDDLYLIAYGPTPEAAYARALITILTGFVFEIETPDDLDERSAGANANDNAFDGSSTNNLTIVPNPARDEVKVMLPESFEQGTIRFFDLNGRMVFSTKADKAIATLSISDFKNGVYFVVAEAAGKQYRSKLVVQH